MRRRVAFTVALTLVTAACTSSGEGTTTTLPPAATTTTVMVTTAPSAATPTTRATTTEPPATTGTTSARDPEPRFVYAVVAEERSRRLTVIALASGCPGCGDEPLMSVELPSRPHNLAAIGSVVYTTHPSAGSVSRVDFATSDVLTATVGTEPHDVKPAPPGNGDAVYVTDEAGGRLLLLDAATLGVIRAVDLPGEPHDVALGNGVAWVTLVGRDELARVDGDQVALLPTGGSPHDLIVDEAGQVWFSNWGSDLLNVFDPIQATTREAPAGVAEPHHFAIGPDGTVWVSDNGGSSIVGFLGDGPVTVDVGSTPHHLAFVGDTIVVAVSGTGEAVLVREGAVDARVPLTPGLHGVAVIVVDFPLATAD